MEQIGLFFSGAALITSILPRFFPILSWIAHCETCEKLRHQITGMLGS